MISRSEFEGLEARVSRIESHLHISSTIPTLHIPYTLLIEQGLVGEDTTQFYKYLENDYHIFVRIYVHGTTLATPKTTTKVIRGYHEYMFIQNYYNVLIIKHSDLGSVGEHVWPKMNTSNTGNIHQYVDKYKRFSLFFGYSNANEPLKEGDNLFSTEGKGVFFIINDRTNNNVRVYLKNHEAEVELINDAIGNGDIVVYKSKNLTKDEVVVKIVSPPPTPVEDDKKRNNTKKIITKD